MKKLLVLAVALVAVAAAVPAFAGGCCSGSAAKADGGFDCSNQCPLAQDANKCRSVGRECVAVSTCLRAAMACAVQKNMARI